MGGLPEALLVRHDREHESDLEEVAEATFHRAGKLFVAHAVTTFQGPYLRLAFLTGN